MNHLGRVQSLVWDPASMPELLPREVDWLRAHPKHRSELLPRVKEPTRPLKVAAWILLAPVAAVWFIGMGVFLIPIFVMLAALFWLPVGVHYGKREAAEPGAVEAPGSESAGSTA